MDRHGAVRRRALVPESRRRHILPFRPARGPGVDRRRREHHLQVALQRRRRDDRRAGPRGPAVGARPATMLAAEGCPDHRHHREPSATRVVLATGVEVWGRTASTKPQDVLAASPGVTVLIHDQACAAEKRRARKPRRNRDAAAPGGDQRSRVRGLRRLRRISNCLSVQPVDTPLGRKTAVDQTTLQLRPLLSGGRLPVVHDGQPAASQRRRARRPGVLHRLPPCRAAPRRSGPTRFGVVWPESAAPAL